jgi:hypothetical protein
MVPGSVTLELASVTVACVNFDAGLNVSVAVGDVAGL